MSTKWQQQNREAYNAMWRRWFTSLGRGRERVGVTRLELATSRTQNERATNCATPRKPSDTASASTAQGPKMKTATPEGAAAAVSES